MDEVEGALRSPWQFLYQALHHCWPEPAYRRSDVMTATSTIASGVPAAQGRRRSTARSRSADTAWSVGVVVAVNAVVVVGLWLRHGGLGTLDQPGGSPMAAGQLTALVGTYAVLVQLLLMSRIGWLERYIGFDRLAVWHRWTGFAAVTLLSAHVVCSTWGYAASSGQSVPAQIGDFVQPAEQVVIAIAEDGQFSERLRTRLHQNAPSARRQVSVCQS